MLYEGTESKSTHQSNKQVVEDEVDGHDGGYSVLGAPHGLDHRLVHHLHPALLRQDLEHGHERLREENTCIYSATSANNIK